MQTQDLTRSSWEFKTAGFPRWRSAVVPGCVHADLLRHGLIPDPFWSTNELAVQWVEEAAWTYRTRFNLALHPNPGEVLELVADGLDTVATVTLNGEVLGRTENMFVSHRWDISRRVRRTNNLLEIRFDSTVDYLKKNRPKLENGELNDPKGRAPAIRKQQCQFGWDWGPRLVTAGIWQNLRIEMHEGNRLLGVKVAQVHKAGHVELRFRAELEKPEPKVAIAGVVRLKGEVVAEVRDGVAVIRKPELWWPHGYGAQPLYELQLDVRSASGRILGLWNRKIGLRTIELDRSADSEGENFRFKVNGTVIFAKGANWIPVHAFVAGAERPAYEDLLQSAVRANMNMIRVWGGGIYEHECFYDLCDELGLLVWQDFMFACALYPADRRFLESVREEAEQQVRRLRHRACLALWCGNNESEHLNHARLKKKPLRDAYDALFEILLPKVVSAIDGVTAYWPSSPHRSNGDTSHAAGEKRGDTHFWDVWHARNPVKEYEKWRFRFCSEFGMQSFASPETNATFCPANDRNLFGPSMENHQKNRGGSQVILDYVFRRYRLPKTQNDLIYLSQLNQAYCMQVGVEHFRRLMPHCAGALYWQLNDCWPAASWSSLEFGGRWRALHHHARRFFAPTLVSAHVSGDETYGVGNYRLSSIEAVELFTIHDGPGSLQAVLRWDLFSIDGEKLLSESKKVRLKAGQSVLQKKLPLANLLRGLSRDEVFLRIALDGENGRISEETVFLAPPRFLDLPTASCSMSAVQAGEREVDLTFTSPVLQHRFVLDLPGVSFHADDNYFDLYPNEPKTVRLHFKENTPAGPLLTRLRAFSLADTVAPS